MFNPKNIHFKKIMFKAIKFIIYVSVISLLSVHQKGIKPNFTVESHLGNINRDVISYRSLSVGH